MGDNITEIRLERDPPRSYGFPVTPVTITDLYRTVDAMIELHRF